MKSGAVRTPRSSKLWRWTGFIALLLVTMAIGLSAQVSPIASDLPNEQQVIAFLTQSIDWYRHRAVERQIATEPTDLAFLEDNRPMAGEIARLAFDFARTEAAIATSSGDARLKPSTNVSGSSPDLQQFLLWQEKTELEARQSSQEIEEIRKKLVAAHGENRRQLEAELGAAQSRVAVLQAGLATLEQLVTFVRSFGGDRSGNLTNSIEDLARTVPEVTNPAAAPPLQTSELASLARPTSPGILSLSSTVSAIEHKLRMLDEEIARTAALKRSSDAIRTPLLFSITKRFEQETRANLQASDLVALQDQKARLNDLAASVKALSPAIVALDKQGVLLDAYASRLRNWRAAVVIENDKAWKELGLRIGALIVLIGSLIIVGAIARRGIRTHVQDPDRRHHMLVIARVGLWFIVVITAAFSVASDWKSLATFVGLLTAGAAVVLQSVILCVAGYFVLVGRRGIKIGDRVQISGVTGDVTDLSWLQFQVAQVDTLTQQRTGSVVTFSNSFVFSSPATGLSKINHEPRKPLEVAAKAQP